MDYKDKVEKRYKKISNYIRKTPLIYSNYFSNKFNSNIYLKFENIQYTGAFKIRGALSKIISLSREERKKTLITASGGNHGLGVCYAAKKFGMKAVVYLPKSTPKMKIEKIKSLGGETIMYGEAWDEANIKAMQIADKKSRVYIHAFSDEDVMLGQASVAYEILKEKKDIDAIICSIGGGGLISGVSRYAKSFNPKIKIFGVETRGADAMFRSINAKRLITLDAITSIAESLGAKRVTELSFNYVKQYVDKLFVVPDSKAINVLIEILDKEKQLVEPASSCSLAACKNIKDIKGKNVAVVICGGNFPLKKLKNYI
ncbi:pyridoxal-phosphate dependent enzyme [Candidatus Woesearchaeota archaeon]|nr:pyridoxal-phosphate dependent enzyme [Candidatus Woesearchaeota archaeon]